MTVTEQIMRDGSWSLDLRADTPDRILSAIQADWYQELHIYRAAIADQLVGSILPRYSGVLLERPSRAKPRITGVGPSWYMGSPDGKTGPIIETALAMTNGSLYAWADALRGPLTLGVADPSITRTFSGSFNNVSKRAVLDFVSYVLGTEWSVNPRYQLSVGGSAFIAPPTPNAVVMRRRASDDHDLNAIRATNLDVDWGVKDRAFRVVATDGSFTNWNDGGSGNSFYGPDNQPLQRTLFIDLPKRSEQQTGNTFTSMSNTDLSAFVTAARGLTDNPTRSVTISTDAYDVGQSLEPDPTVPVNVGKWLWVYDPDYGLYDTTNVVDFNGQQIYPTKMRVMTQTWPIRAGMGVFLLSRKTGNVVDLSRWIVPETSDATLEVGSLSPRLGL